MRRIDAFGKIQRYAKRQMSQVVRGAGVTESERYLAALAEKTFLRLWSYPNVFVDKRDGKNQKNRQGKELADLLIVCGDDVLIFSDKSIAWPNSELSLAWSRWYRRAVEHSVDQLAGAARWVETHADRLYLDRECTMPFPFSLPPKERRRIHLIAVAVGASEACRAHFEGGIGTLVIEPAIRGTQHYDSTLGHVAKPFRVGDANPDGTFVHVFDPEALDVVFSELDTVVDFTTYLTRRAAFMRSGNFVGAPGEEDLLALFLKNIGPDGNHDFVADNGKPFGPHDQIIVKDGTFNWLHSHPGYQSKKVADEPSYFWDRLIELFVGHVLDGTSVPPDGKTLSVSMSERALRVMARESRMQRRMLGSTVLDAIKTAESVRAPKFARRILPGPDSANKEVGYIFLILAYPDFHLQGGYEQYRQTRASMLEAYCYDLIEQQPELVRVVGIAVDASPNITGRKGGSEDLALLERPEWTPDLMETLGKWRDLYGLRKTSDLVMQRLQVQEYPDSAPRISRQQRRAAERAARKRRTSM
tara:strand:- start:21570 stop:23159 length:1590 start_codon:yes stop_codon:yes gene_type:complete